MNRETLATPASMEFQDRMVFQELLVPRVSRDLLGLLVPPPMAAALEGKVIQVQQDYREHQALRANQE